MATINIDSIFAMYKKHIKKEIQIISLAVLLGLSFILCNYTRLAELHGKSSAPIIVGFFGIAAFVISCVFNLKALSFAAAVGYIIAFFIGVCMNTDGIVLGNGAIHETWMVWLFSYWIFIGIGISCDFFKKLILNFNIGAALSKNVVPFIGLLVGMFIVFSSVFYYAAKPITINDVLQHKPSFRGTVIEINDNDFILVKVNGNEPIFKINDKILISTNIKMKGARHEKIHIGDNIKVYYDGSISESYPPQINEVYLIFLKNSSEQNAE